MLRRVSLLLALPALLSLAIVGCGGDDDDGDGESAVITATPTEATGDEAAETEAEEPPATEAPMPDSTPTPEDEQAATESEDLPDESALVLPPERDESISVNGRVLGDPDAAVSVVEYGDFQ